MIGPPPPQAPPAAVASAGGQISAEEWARLDDLPFDELTPEQRELLLQGPPSESSASAASSAASPAAPAAAPPAAPPAVAGPGAQISAEEWARLDDLPFDQLTPEERELLMQGPPVPEPEDPSKSAWLSKINGA